MPKTIRNKKRGSKRNRRNSRKKMMKGGVFFDNVDIPNTGHVKIKIKGKSGSMQQSTAFFDNSTVNLYNDALRRLQIYNTGIKRYNDDSVVENFITFYAVSQGKNVTKRIGYDRTGSLSERVTTGANVAITTSLTAGLAPAALLLSSGTESDLRNDFGRSDCYNPQPTYSFIEKGLLSIFRDKQIICSTACYITHYAKNNIFQINTTISSSSFGFRTKGKFAYIVFKFVSFAPADAFGSSWIIEVLGYYPLTNLIGDAKMENKRIDNIFTKLPQKATYNVIQPQPPSNTINTRVTKKNEEFWYNFIPYVHPSFNETYETLHSQNQVNKLENVDKDNLKIGMYNVTPNTRFAMPNDLGSNSSNQLESFNPQYSNMPQRINSAPQRPMNNYNIAGNSQSLPRFQSGPPYTQVNPRPNSDGTFTFPPIEPRAPTPPTGWAAKDQAVQDVYRDSTKRRGARYPLN
jgi:hypothetical protein